jgi:hypothetical protein
MTDEDVVARVAELLGVGYVKHVSSRNPAWKPSYFAHLQGQRAVRLMLELRPLMGERRKAQIDAAVATWAPRPSRISREQGEAIVGEFRAGRSAKSLAEAYGISKWSVYALHQGRYFGKSTEWRPSLPG